VSSSDPEKDAARLKARVVRAWLAESGWPASIAADSGNGYHLLYRIDLESSAESTEQVGDGRSGSSIAGHMKISRPLVNRNERRSG